MNCQSVHSIPGNEVWILKGRHFLWPREGEVGPLLVGGAHLGSAGSSVLSPRAQRGLGGPVGRGCT